MNKELIEKLKDKNYVRAFGMMLPEEQECFEKAEEKNCLKYHGQTGIKALWLSAFHFDFTDTYAIKPDYQPEPEYVDLEIVKFEQDLESGTQSSIWLGVHCDANGTEFLPYQFTHLHCLPSLPNFHCFYCKDNTVGDCEMDVNWVSGMRDEGQTVFARFRK